MKYYLGSDFKILITVRDKNTGQVIDLSAQGTTLELKARHKTSGTDIVTQTLASGLVAADLSNGKVYLIVNDEDTTGANTGQYDIVGTLGQSDGDFTDGIDTSIAKVENAFELVEV